MEFQLNYSFDLVTWHVAQDGIDGVVVTVHNGGSDKITARIPADPSQRIFSYLALSIATP